ncbi:hypothetical protein [Streptomyces sp. NPDC002619]
MRPRDRRPVVLLGHQSWRLYVADCGWSWNETEEWPAGQVSAALLGDRTG